MNSRNPANPSSWQKILGIELSPVSHRERLVSALGGLVGVLAVYFASHAIGGPPATPLLIFSIGAMHYLRCIHPPGGATALVAVLGGAPVQALGFGFVLAPVLLNVMILLVAAVAFNAFFPWRRYPVFLARRTVRTEAAGDGYEAISHEDFVYALTQMDSFIDVSEEDLLRIYGLATGRHREVEAQAAAAAGAISPSALS